jgi:hypothetical protein
VTKKDKGYAFYDAGAQRVFEMKRGFAVRKSPRRSDGATLSRPAGPN